ncbi:MAG: DUF3549 family protein [Algicola sp.]|nr:DUF3549 family protein [Algicola sp.]
MTDQLSTIHQLLESTDTQYRVFDMGRRVQKISQDDFRAFENATVPYPYPLKKKAWFAILFWDKKRSEQQFLWFLNFELDEQGKLIQAVRNHFIHMVIEVLGTDLTEGNDDQDKLDNNPYTFKPDQNKLAILNAQIKSQMKQNASIYYEHAQNYLRGLLGWQDWQSVGVQGLGDFVTRLDSDDNLASLLKALPNLPQEVEMPLLSLLEHISIPTQLTETLYDKALHALKNNDQPALINCLRAISNSKAIKIRQKLLTEILASDLATDQQVLLVITGRCWLDLQDDTLRHQFLESLASASPDQVLFQGIVADLVAIPAIRSQLLQSFRNPERSATLATAIGHLFSQ